MSHSFFQFLGTTFAEGESKERSDATFSLTDRNQIARQKEEGG